MTKFKFPQIKTYQLAIVLAIVSVISLFIGVSDISITGLWHFHSHDWLIFSVSRVPRLVAILISGIGLSVCGLIMQHLANNKFVSPTTAGTMSCAKLGILLSLMFFTSSGLLVKAAFAVAVAFIGSLLFMKLLRSLHFKDIIYVPLIGLMFGQVIDALTEFFAYKFDLILNITAWLQGNFTLVIKDRYELLYFCIPALIIAFLYAHKFAIVGLGKDNATSLGVNYNFILYVGLIIIALVTGLIYVIAGNIPFVGLIIPNIVSLYKGDNVQKTLVFTALLGALFTLVCDIIARLVIFPYEVTVGAVIGSIGSLVFIYLIYRRYRHG